MNELEFQINNNGTPGTVYVPATDPSLNKLALVIGTNANVTLTAGQPVEESAAPTANGSLFYLNLKSLGLSQSELSALQCKADGWTCSVYTDEQVLCMAPQQSTSLQAGQTVTLQISNFTCANPPAGSSVQVHMDFYHAAPIASGSLPFIYNELLTLQAPPNDDLDLHEALSVTVEANEIVQSVSPYPEIDNTLTLVFGPGPNPKVINTGNNTAFTVGFVYADDQYGYGALTTVANAFKFVVAAGDNASDWLITPPPEGAQNPAWMLQPPEGQPLLGTGEGATVTFSFSDIVARFQPGTTLMVVSCTGVPGYRDGAYSILLDKVAHVTIQSITADPNPAVLSNGQANVTLSWVASSPSLTLMPGSVPVTNKTQQTVTIDDDTTFTLIAQGESPANTASADIKVDILPVINSVSAEPANVYYKDFPHQVLLDWAVDSKDPVTLTSSAGGTPQVLPATYTGGQTVDGPQMFTITPKDELSLFIRRNEVISAFKLQSRAVNLNAIALSVALSPIADICAVAQAGTDGIVVLETITDSPVGAPVTAGAGPVCLQFSHDGNYLFVANQGDRSLSVLSVTFNSASNGYVFTKLTDVSLSGVPVDLDVAADDSYVFVASNSGTTTGYLDVIADLGQNNFQVKNSVRLNYNVNAVAALPSSAQVFMVSSSNTSVAVIGYNGVNDVFQLVRSIGGFQDNDGPCDIAVAGQDAGTLLIACKGSNAVYAVDKETSSLTGKQKLTVGSAPVGIVTIEQGSYAYVANSGDNTLAVISCFKGSGLCTVLETGLPNGARPAALAAAQSGNVIYVANSDSSGLTVWNTQTYADEGVNRAGDLVTSVAGSSNHVAAWHNFNIQISFGGKTPFNGLSIYDRASQTTSLVNASAKYVDFEFWPTAGQARAFAVVHGDNHLYVLETQKYTTVKQIPFSTSTTYNPLALDLSPFGNMVFVLTVDTGSAFHLVAISCDLAHDNFAVVADVPLFTETGSSAHALAAVSDGSIAFVTDSLGEKMYVVSKGNSGKYALEPNTYSLVLPPRGIVCSPDDRHLYLWLNGASGSAFARFDVQNRGLQNFALPGTTSFEINALDMSPDGGRLFVVDSNFGGLRVFSTDSMQNVENLQFPEASFPMDVAVAPDASEVYTANAFSGDVSVGRQISAAGPDARAQALSSGQDYQGIFLRDYIGETPASNAGSGWCFSPDILPYGVQLFPNPPDLATNYGTDYGNNINTVLGEFNNVYVRGLNTVNGPQKSRVYFYSVEAATVLLPSQWSPYGFSFGGPGNLQNWLDISGGSLNAVAYGPAPLSWKPDPAWPHYCLVAWVDNSSTPSPPDLSSFGNFASNDQVGQFIMSHPNMAWRNTFDIQPPGQFMNAQTNAPGPQAGGQVTVGVVMQNVALGGTIQFTLVNSNGTINYNSPAHTIDTNTFSQTINWPANAPTPTLTYTYTPAQGSNLQGGERITAFTSYLPTASLMKKVLLRHPGALIGVTRDGLSAVQEMVLGAVRFTYTPNLST